MKKTMRIEAYLRVLSDEVTVHAIHQEAKISDATIEKLKARRDTIEDDTWWNWRTPRIPIATENTDDQIKALLLKYRPIFPAIKKHEAKTDVYLEIVTHYDENEYPRGLYLSAETILLLGELGAALDNDVVIRHVSEG